MCSSRQWHVDNGGVQREPEQEAHATANFWDTQIFGQERREFLGDCGANLRPNAAQIFASGEVKLPLEYFVNGGTKFRHVAEGFLPLPADFRAMKFLRAINFFARQDTGMSPKIKIMDGTQNFKDTRLSIFSEFI